jgi:beta-lactam-binding protein with PASTA domain
MRADAEAALAGRNLGTRVVVLMTGESRPGIVIDQYPQDGMAAYGAEVELTVEAEWPHLPNVEGKTLYEAERLLHKAGFDQIDVATTQIDDTVPRDTVIRQDPEPGVPTPTTETIILEVSGDRAVTTPDGSPDPRVKPGAVGEERPVVGGTKRTKPAKPRGPWIQANSDIDFGRVAPGEASTRALTVTNAGDAPLHITSIQID